MEVETCENLRPMNNSNAKGMAASYASGGQYGFSDKVVDGITLTVNSVILTLKSHAFIASFQVYQIVSDADIGDTRNRIFGFIPGMNQPKTKMG